MIFKRILSLAFLITSMMWIACSSNRSENETPSETLIKANEFHQQSLDLREEVMQLEIRLKENEIDYEELKDELKIWDKDIIEVPGMEHSHEDTHQRKYHVHNPPKQFTDEEHFNYQEMMYDEIFEIRQKMVRKLSPEVMG